jgi:hypothetical protein
MLAGLSRGGIADLKRRGVLRSKWISFGSSWGSAVMLQTTARRATTQNHSGQVLETEERVCPIDHDAALARLMPRANSLTRAITTAILARHGLLEDCSAPRGGAALQGPSTAPRKLVERGSGAWGDTCA